MSTAAELATAIIEGAAFASNPAGAVASAVSDAAQAQQRAFRDGPALASRLTRVACLVVAAADNPNITRGAVLDALVAKYGDGGV